ncbi:hypothetical protein GMRT_11141 [Giardia muris]|uniref:Uncharacterized protein n=1 Tax=Giardia muris TaxID=5742 RepID=A0A4Z1SUI9_GIAMU|nr:hypothetical protein GMRT_11141 [Giardia muris]|eukprot:TNJ29370.1 hypothetical protein GMRT_11141 [Giardia muris]
MLSSTLSPTRRLAGTRGMTDSLLRSRTSGGTRLGATSPSRFASPVRTYYPPVNATYIVPSDPSYLAGGCYPSVDRHERVQEPTFSKASAMTTMYADALTSTRLDSSPGPYRLDSFYTPFPREKGQPQIHSAPRTAYERHAMQRDAKEIGSTISLSSGTRRVPTATDMYASSVESVNRVFRDEYTTNTSFGYGLGGGRFRDGSLSEWSLTNYQHLRENSNPLGPSKAYASISPSRARFDPASTVKEHTASLFRSTSVGKSGRPTAVIDLF